MSSGASGDSGRGSTPGTTQACASDATEQVLVKGIPVVAVLEPDSGTSTMGGKPRNRRNTG